MQNRDWKALMLLSIALPMGLLATFRIAGITREPTTARVEEVAGSVNWSMKRPAETCRIDDKVTNIYLNASVLINFTVWVVRYSENYEYPPSNGGDYVDLGVYASGNVSNGFIYSMNVTFLNLDKKTCLVFKRTVPSYDILDNLKISKIGASIWGDGDAYFETIASNQPQNCSLKTWSVWVFSDENSVDHRTDSLLETIYYDGDTYQKIVVPITLEMGLDSNNSLETAQPVNEGDYNLLYIGRYDQVDYYTIGVDEGRVIDVWASAIGDAVTTFYLAVVDSLNITRASSGPSFHEFVHCLTNYTGDWFIKVQAYDVYYGLYNLSLNVKIAGDINSDGRVNAKDAVLLGVAFGSQPADSNWNTNADIDIDGFVNAKDATILGAHFGESEEGYGKMSESG